MTAAVHRGLVLQSNDLIYNVLSVCWVYTRLLVQLFGEKNPCSHQNSRATLVNIYRFTYVFELCPFTDCGLIQHVVFGSALIPKLVSLRLIMIISILLNIFKTVKLRPKSDFCIPCSFICSFAFHLEMEPRSQNISITYSGWLLNVIPLNTITTLKKKKKVHCPFVLNACLMDASVSL